MPERASSLYKQIRCQVCQGESVDESQAPLAKDMRHLIDQQIEAGQTDVQIKEFLVERYGASVLMETPFDASTIWLWAIPCLFVLIGIWLVIRRR